jgi:hypothetical protein
MKEREARQIETEQEREEEERHGGRVLELRRGP